MQCEHMGDRSKELPSTSCLLENQTNIARKWSWVVGEYEKSPSYGHTRMHKGYGHTSMHDNMVPWALRALSTKMILRHHLELTLCTCKFVDRFPTLNFIL